MLEKKPNILMLVADQQRYDCIGYSRQYPVMTPNIDRLASQGAWFNNAFTPIPLCCPARQSFLNGRRAESFGAFWNFEAMKVNALQPSDYSWTSELKSCGYQMGYVGKWHVNPEKNPTEFGYDHYAGDEHYYPYRSKKYPELELKNGWFGEKDPVLPEDTRTHWFTAKAVDLIKNYSAKGEPWHVRLDFAEPHLPCQPISPFHEMYKPEEIPMWKSFNDEFLDKPYIQKQQLYNWNIEDYSWEDWAPIVARYYGIITQYDSEIGKVLNLLDELGIADNTIVIYTADHGDMCGGHRMMDKHFVMYDDIVKVPMIIRWPGVIKEGTVCEDFVYNFLDLPPTILEMLEISPHEFFHGRSLLPLLKGEKVSDWRKEVVSTYNGNQFGLFSQRMIRNSKWKYVWNATDIDELYDLENDPDELTNVIHRDEFGSIVKDLRKQLYNILINEGDNLVNNIWLRDQFLNSKKL